MIMHGPNTTSKAPAGFGLALLMVFIGSTILIGTSMGMLLGPATTAYLGAPSVNQSFAMQVASSGLDEAQANILSLQALGNTIGTSYRYPASGTNQIILPDYPGSGSSSVLGNYYVTIVQARGYTFLLKITTTVGDQVYEEYRLVQLNKPVARPLPYLAYALRKVVPTYNGNAVRVRCTQTSTQDIGFDGSGDLNRTALLTCLGDSVLPLDVTTGGKLAYSLRKVRAGYTGNAIKVRRSSDNGTSDIGFDANGNLDYAALKTFVGSGAAYVTTWYDQGTSGQDLMQITPSKQPRIVLNGVLDTSGAAPSIVFDGSDDFLVNTSLNGTVITGANVSAFVVANQERTGTSGIYDRYVTLHKTNTSGYEDWQVAGGFQLFAVDDDATHLLTQTSSFGVANGQSLFTIGSPFQATSVHDSSNNLRLYESGALISSGSISATFSPDRIYVGTGAYNSTNTGDYLKGRMSEVLIFNGASAMTLANQQKIERSEGHYFQAQGMLDGFVTTWYDQSGSGRNVTQSDTTKQPVINLASSKAAVYFNGTTNVLETTSLSKTTSVLTATAAARFDTGAPGNGRIISIWQNGQTSDWNNTGSSALIFKSNTNMVNARNNDLSSSGYLDSSLDIGATMLFTGSQRTLRVKQATKSATSDSTTTNATGNLVINNLRIGAAVGGASHEFWKGFIYEAWIFDSALTATQYGDLETEVYNYYGI